MLSATYLSMRNKYHMWVYVSEAFDVWHLFAQQIIHFYMGHDMMMNNRIILNLILFQIVRVASILSLTR